MCARVHVLGSTKQKWSSQVFVRSCYPIQKVSSILLRIPKPRVVRKMFSDGMYFPRKT